MKNLKYQKRKEIKDFFSEQYVYQYKYFSISIEMNAFVKFKNSAFQDLTFYHLVTAEQLVKNLFDKRKKIGKISQ